MARFAALKAEIDYELHNLKQLSKELDDILSATEEGSIARTRAVGSLLHDFYSGAEKIFRQIAVKIDQDLPTGEGWHIQLLKRMAMSIEGIRPQVIDEKLENDLEEYLRFRHLFRNIYGFELKWDKCQPLVEKLKYYYQGTGRTNRQI
ncbi:hypothetical protein [Acetomicrobium sp.]|jgi:hypothetical protein|uniref:ribonuclease toxin HepT-like protein n=1 Tax=Acetomicrobium sp. TaxID=1872099 RepID=UPI002B25E58A|nr:hypothetical protein [Acetomicrobium sp.]HOM98295.1 hypothetical protein [Acetomicrobium sp.]